MQAVMCSVTVRYAVEMQMRLMSIHRHTTPRDPLIESAAKRGRRSLCRGGVYVLVRLLCIDDRF